MAVTTADVEKKAKEKAAKMVARVEQLEKEIDALLLKEAPKKGQEVTYKGLPMNEPNEVVDALIKMYEKAGWKVTSYKGAAHDACNNLIFSYQL